MRIGRLELVRLVEQAQRLEDFEEAIAESARAGRARQAADAGSIIDFLEVTTGDAFDVAPEQAISYFKAKGLKPRFSYADLLDEQHDHAFTVAKMMNVDMLGQVRASLDAALATGQSFSDWADSITPILQSGGWWGRKEVVDPLSGQTVVAQLGSPWRLETIFRTNMQTAYAAGAWQEIDAQKDIAPFLMYDAVDDLRTRPLHASWDQKVLPVKSPWWGSHYPPNGYNCRCGVIQLSADEVEALGLTVATDPPDDGTVKWTNPRTGDVHHVPRGLDPGFEHNAGKSWKWSLQELLAEKTAALQADMRAAANKVKAAAKAQVAEHLTAATGAQADAAAAMAKAALARAKAVAEEKSKQWVAQQQLDLIAKGKDGGGAIAGFKVKALKQLVGTPAWTDATAAEKLDLVLWNAGELKKASDAAKGVALYKKQVIAGKVPTASAVKAFKSLSEGDAKAVVQSIAAAKDAAAAAAAKKSAEEAATSAAASTAQKVATKAAPPNPAALTQVGPQGGSNPGGLFLDADTGARWYVKWPTDAEALRNEALAANLYRLGGVDVPEVHLITFNGRSAIASRFVDGAAKASAADLAKAAGTAEGFAFDAWLGNWDVVGLQLDNLLLKDGKAVRIDAGGALRFRAQGTPKPASSFGPSVGELDSLKNAGINPQAASVFSKIDQAGVEVGVRRLLAIDEAEIRSLVETFGPTNAGARKHLADMLVARRADIAKRFPALSKPSAEALQAAIADAQETIKHARARVDEAILTAVRGIAKRASTGSAIEAKDLERVAAAANELAALRLASEAMTATARAEMLSFYEAWVDDLRSAAQKAGTPAKWSGSIFKPHVSGIDIDATRVKVPPPPELGGVTPPGQAKKIIAEAFGETTAGMKVPRGPGAAELTARMHEEHARAIAAYTGSAYRSLNLSLRTNRPSPQQKRVEALINEALALAPKYKGTVYRGLSLGSERAAFIATHKAAQKTGSLIGHAQFNSTSRSAGSSFGGNVRLVIESKTGVHIKAISLHPGEDEVLFSSEAKFRVEKVEDGAGLVTIRLSEV